MCHMKEWNPPPFLDSYKCCTSGHLDVWKNCAQLMSLLEKAKTNKMMLSVEEKDGKYNSTHKSSSLCNFTFA